MIPVIPKQRENKHAVHRPFSDLVRYLVVQKDRDKGIAHHFAVAPGVDDAFSNLIDYATTSVDALTDDDKCIAVRTHGVTSMETAILEMNAVAEQNRRSPEPAFHFILSWPEFEKPEPEAMFDAATHALRALGLSQHQYIIAVHDNTDNRHCHIAVNRIHPVTFKSQHLEWAKLSLSIAARESEIKHGWFHDNGAYIVQVTPEGEKEIVANPAHKDFERSPDHQDVLPTWHDPESLESWLKGYVGGKLKRSLKELQNWHGLHAWLDRYGIALKDTGGGGLRLTATSYVTGEVLELPASKGLRILKRQDLEKRWGPFSEPVEATVTMPDLSHLTPELLSQGAHDVIDRSFIDRNLHHLVHRPERARRLEAEKRRRLSEVSRGNVANRGEDPEMLLQDPLRMGLGDRQAGEDTQLRWAEHGGRSGRGDTGADGSIAEPKRRQRDLDARERRREERAAARADLRKRYSLYRRVLNDGADEYYGRLRLLRREQSEEIKGLNKTSRQAKLDIKKSNLSASDKLIAVAAIDIETTKKRADLDARYGNRRAEHRATRPPALGWREWLHEQSNLGDQAAVSALRGIVYQAKRDAKNAGPNHDLADDFDEERAAQDAAYRAEQHQRTLTRLIEQERQEVAIRAARADAMRPHEMDALLIRYSGIHWHVTGNGNIEFADNANHLLFTDRGNRITFDRAIVTDDELRLALVHSRQKFGRCITLSGSDTVFTARMARLADDLGLVVLNPEMASVVAQHRADRQARQAATALAENRPPLTYPEPGQSDMATPLVLESDEPVNVVDLVRRKVLAIDPGATFDVVNTEGQEYFGPVVAVHEDDQGQMFAQHIGRSHYVIHTGKLPAITEGQSVDIRYRNHMIDISTGQENREKDR